MLDLTPRLASDDTDSHPLRKVPGLRDPIPLQILLVFGMSWAGSAALQAGTHLSFWLMAAALLFLPVAAFVQHGVRICPYEGGAYQWTELRRREQPS
jgi:amino acid transporter